MSGKAISLHSDKKVTNFLLTLAWSLMVFCIFAAIIILPRLPGSTFVARSHLKEEIHSTEGNLTVGPDGTTRLGKHYGANLHTVPAKILPLPAILQSF
jgi:hypothetical protein